jgi:hypothetical protein
VIRRFRYGHTRATTLIKTERTFRHSLQATRLRILSRSS